MNDLLTNTPEPVGRIKYLWTLGTVYIATLFYYLSVSIGSELSTEQTNLLIAGFVFMTFYTAMMWFHIKPYLMDPVMLMSGVVFISVTLKIPYLVDDPTVLNYLIRGKPITLLTTGTYMILISVFMFMLGYKITTYFNGGNYTIQYFRAEWNKKRFFWVCITSTAITLIAALAALNEIGLSSLLEKFSTKRFLDLEGASGRFSSLLYVYYKVAVSAKIVATLCFTYILLTENTKNKRVLLLSLAALSFSISIFIPVIFNAKGQSVLLIMDLIVIGYFSGIKMRLKTVLVTFVCGYCLLAFTTIARSGIERYTGVIDAILGRRYLMDLSKTSLIFDYFGTTRDWMYGETFMGWLFLIVPTSVMPNKPMFSETGKYIGRLIYGYDVSGVPPGILGELYLNFGWPGILFGMLIIGIAIGIFWRWFIIRTTHPAIMVFGAMVLVRFGVYLFNNDFGTFLIKILIEVIPVILILFWTVKTFQMKEQSNG